MNKIEQMINELCPNGVEFKKLGEVCEIITGGEAPQNSVSKPDENNKYAIWANGQEIYGYTNKYKIDKDCCTISSIGANTGTVYFREAYFTPIIRLKVLVPKSNNVISKYLFYFLSSIKIYSKKSSVPNMNSDDVRKLEIPLPPLPIQQEIVNILDKFTELEAELEARRKQYEYYRNKLLTFNGLNENAGGV
jgi:type I restriction enzyme S subunit